MAIARYEDQDVGVALFARGDENILRQIYDDYMANSRASMNFDILDGDGPAGVATLDEIDESNRAAAYKKFASGRPSNYFLEEF